MSEKVLVDKSVVITDEVIDELLEDWLQRDDEGYVHVDRENKLHWEETLEESDAYSAYFKDFESKEDAIKNAYKMAKDIVAVMRPPEKVHIKIHSGEESMTDGKKMFVSTAVFDDESLTLGAKVDVFVGLAVHETCHLCYTDFSCVGGSNRVVAYLNNLIEDERIESVCCKDNPGFGNFIEATKYYYFDRVFLETYSDKDDSKLSPIDKILRLLLYVIRYPKYLTEEMVMEWAHYLLAIKKIILPYPKSTKEARKTAEKIFEVIKEFYKEEMKKDAISSGVESAEGGEVLVTGGGTAPDTSKTDDATKGLEVITEGGSDHGEEPDEEKVKSKIDVDVDTSLIKKLIEKVDEEAHSIKESTEVSAKGGLLGDICEGVAEIGEGSDTIFNKVKGNKEVYQKSYKAIERYIPAVAKILKGNCRDYKLIHRSMRSGVLDTSKLAEAYQGVPTVYIREGKVKTDRISVCVLIDESGSMWMSSRMDSARNMAVLLNEALGRLSNVDLFIYGHSGDIRWRGETALYVYREGNYQPKYAIGSANARSENRDGVAIIEVAKRVRSLTEENVLMFVLSDGAPAASGYSGISAITHTRDCVHKAEKLGFNIIQICMGDPTYDVSKMFHHHIVLKDMNSFAIKLANVIKKSILKSTQIRVS